MSVLEFFLSVVQIQQQNTKKPGSNPKLAVTAAVLDSCPCPAVLPMATGGKGRFGLGSVGSLWSTPVQARQRPVLKCAEMLRGMHPGAQMARFWC